MLSLRTIARSAPRSVARLSTKAARPQVSLFRSIPQTTWTPSLSRVASFHISAIRRQESSVQDELVAKLQSEISIEEDMREDENLSSNIKDYLENSPFEIVDKPGSEEIVLTRTFGDEKITVTFTTADLNNMDQEQEDMDNALYDDGENAVDDAIGAQSGGANTKGAINQGRTSGGNIRVAPEDRIAPADREELEDEPVEDEEQQPSFPARANIRVERPSKGSALVIEAVAQDGEFLIENLFYFPKADLADPASAEKDWERRTLYTGPPFGNLDEDLQVLLERYLEERGVNTRLALFIPDYIDHKEQKEYLGWLNNLKSFVQ